MFGYQTYDSRDDSRNCWWVALLSFGEGWHNNHHAVSRSARYGLAWWELDMNYLALRASAKVSCWPGMSGSPTTCGRTWQPGRHAA